LLSFSDALAMAHELSDLRLEARALLGIGISHHRRNRNDDARTPFERALAIIRGYDFRRESVVHGYLGAIEQQAGHMHAARTHYREALRAIETGGAHNRAFLESTVRLRLAFLALDEGNPAEAQLECEQGIVLAIEGGGRRLQGLAYGCLALARWSMGQLDEADHLIAGAVQALAEARDHLNEGFTQSVRGAILAARDRIHDAADAFAHADAALAAVGDHVGLAVSSIYHGHLDLARSRQAAADRDAARALAHRSEAERRAAQGSSGVPATPARIALRTLRQALGAASAGDADPSDEETLEIDQDRRWIRIPGRVRWVQFGRQTVPWRLLLELCQARVRAPGQAISADALIAAGWPGQSVLPTAAQNRLHVAINALRKLGLRPLIVTRDDGYLLTPSVRIRWVAST
jgi:tetratricopeptide (TPR) repeat protein